jgi:hypothetical protein
MLIVLFESFRAAILQWLNLRKIYVKTWRGCRGNVRRGFIVLFKEFLKLVFLVVFWSCLRHLDVDTVLGNVVGAGLVIKGVCKVLVYFHGYELFILLFQGVHFWHWLITGFDFLVAVYLKIVLEDVPRKLSQFLNDLDRNMQSRDIVQLGDFFIVGRLLLIGLEMLIILVGATLMLCLTDLIAYSKKHYWKLQNSFDQDFGVLNLLEKVFVVSKLWLLIKYFLSEKFGMQLHNRSQWKILVLWLLFLQAWVFLQYEVERTRRMGFLIEYLLDFLYFLVNSTKRLNIWLDNSHDLLE